MEEIKARTTLDDCRKLIRDIPDFPREGILFKDITPLLANGPALQEVVNRCAALCEQHGLEPEVVACPEARGFIFGSALAYRLGIGMVPIRKPGKLPHQTCSVEYALEYATDSVEMHTDAVQPGQRVLLLDDLLATGGTIAACAELLERRGARVTACMFVVELEFLKGRGKLEKYPVYSLIRY